MNQKHYRFPVVVEHDTNGYFAFCPELEGCYTQGASYEEAIKNIRDAIRLHIEDRIANGEEIPQAGEIMVAALDVAV
jgi:predicted RNase H-like HicB family nuclease